jgi:putative ABC transport system ATP-binding protein
VYQLTDVSKLYRKGRSEVNALRRVNLTVEDGEFLTIQGPTGSGKTTLLLLMGAGWERGASESCGLEPWASCSRTTT